MRKRLRERREGTVIVHKHVDGELFDQEALAVENQVSVRTVRRRCKELHVACDARTRAPLYDADAAAAALAAVRPRPARTAAAQRGRMAAAIA